MTRCRALIGHLLTSTEVVAPLYALKAAWPSPPSAVAAAAPVAAATGTPGQNSNNDKIFGQNKNNCTNETQGPEPETQRQSEAPAQANLVRVVVAVASLGSLRPLLLRSRDTWKE